MTDGIRPTIIRAVSIDGIGRIQKVMRTNGFYVGMLYSVGWNIKTRRSGWTFDINEADKFIYKEAESLVLNSLRPMQTLESVLESSRYPMLGNIVG